MVLGYKDMLAEAESQVASVNVTEAAELLGSEEITLVDIRDIRELEREGLVPGSKHAPRGMLEFWIDPQSPYHKPWFAEDRTFVFYCASGWRSLLAAETAQRMGLKTASLRGGFTAWREAGQPVETRAPR
ncbi:rhodanese-like domain-containing protein [Thalassococcus profundi]|uniref:Rhodanese-like domain-containing protein n=1 Tax=Thalassococcus profundi TaxID=2282382 RepID=A0A369TNG3_9RHOB|nr:rhodanese-like domain-containing protein [Thalassococcus profundi]RDD66244.1 rhodanese-like domain-containing protein [Thalassococcus profundi]